MRQAGVSASTTLIRTARLSQIDRVHGIILMVELGDLREGIMPDDLSDVVRETLRLPNIELWGIGTNLACRSGVSPDARNMAELSALAVSIENEFGVTIDVVSVGNSANLEWALGDSGIGRINDLRLGEAILLGWETLHRGPIDGLHAGDHADSRGDRVEDQTHATAGTNRTDRVRREGTLR